jgi:hypothetical protein
MKTKQFVKVIVAAICLCSMAHATTYVWDGGSGGADSNWSQAANWNPNGAPGEANEVYVIDATTQSTSVVNSGLTYSGTHFNVTKLTIGTGITLEVNQNLLVDEAVISGVVTIKGTAALDIKVLTIGGENIATTVTKQNNNTVAASTEASE